MDSVNNILSNLPANFFQGSGDNHLEGMAKFSTLVGAVNAVSGEGDPKKKQGDIPQTELDKFGNWTGQTDTKVTAKDLQKRGLVGANQLLEATPDITDPNSIRSSRSDWIVGAAQKIVSQALRLDIRDSSTFDANIPALTSTINSRYKDAINEQSFNNNYPNFFKVIRDSILPEQFAKYDKQKSVTALK